MASTTSGPGGDVTLDAAGVPAFDDADLEARLVIPGREDALVRLRLTGAERRILWTLLHAVDSAGTGSQIRIAGGWVRDKLLGRPNEDIDVAVDNISGVALAEHVNAFLRRLGEKTSNIGVIQANPDQSKHLETATARVLGSWIDFVHLRAEQYEEGSRIPKVTLGTPLQDAERRDFTINSLFYNASAGAVEDLTGKGCDDLAAGLLRTPVEPHVTFTDDPLRVLRAVRFATRYGFRMVPELRAAASEATVHAALAAKVSRERVGIELDGMLLGPRPTAAMRSLHALGLAPVAFALPATPSATKLAGQLLAPANAAGILALSLLSPSGVGVPEALPSASAPADYLLACAPDALTGADVSALPISWLPAGLHIVNALHYVLTVTRGALAAWGLPRTAPTSAAGTAAAGGGGGSSSCAGAPPSAPFSAPLPSDPWVGFSAPAAERAHLSPAEAAADACTGHPGLPPEDARLLMLAAQTLPLAPLCRVASKPRSKPERAAWVILSEGLKRPHKDAEAVQALHQGATCLAEQTLRAGGPDRLSVGLCLRSQARDLWPLALLLAAAHCTAPVLHDPAAALTAGSGVAAAAGGGASPALSASPLPSGASGTATEPRPAAPVGSGKAVEPHAAVIGAVLTRFAHLGWLIRHEWRLEGCWAWRPLLSGTEAKAAVGDAACGPALGVLMEEQARWQLLHPDGSREEAAAHLSAFAGDGRLTAAVAAAQAARAAAAHG